MSEKLNCDYFKRKLTVIVRDVEHFTPMEMFTELCRLMDVAKPHELTKQRDAALESNELLEKENAELREAARKSKEQKPVAWDVTYTSKLSNYMERSLLRDTNLSHVNQMWGVDAVIHTKDPLYAHPIITEPTTDKQLADIGRITDSALKGFTRL